MALQRYVSDELTHFVGRAYKTDGTPPFECEEKQYVLLKEILGSSKLGIVTPGINFSLTVSPASISTNTMYNPQVVCFCDIPIPDLKIHMDKYSYFGIAFQREFLLTKGARPVFYVPLDALDTYGLTTMPKKINPGEAFTHDELFSEMLRKYTVIFNNIFRECGKIPEPNRELVIELLTLKMDLDVRVFSFIKYFEASKSEDDSDNYYMEREWRLLGSLQFCLQDVWRIILPREYAKRFRQDLPGYDGQITFAE